MTAVLMLAAASARAEGPACPPVDHQPRADVAHSGDAASLSPGLKVTPEFLDIPVVVDVLKGRRAPTGQPIEGKAAVARITSGKDGWTMSSITNPEAPTIKLGEPPCQPHIARPSILKPKPRPKG